MLIREVLEGDLLVGETATYTASYTITQSDVDSGNVSNSVFVEATSPSGSTTDDISDDGDDLDGNTTDDPTVTGIPESPAIEVLKTAVVTDDGNNDLGVNDTITYTITVENTGNVTLNNVTVVDTPTDAYGNPLVLDSGPTFVSSTQGSSEGILIVGEIATYTATYTITQSDVDSGSVDNTAVGSGDSPSGTNVSDVSDNPGDPNGSDDPTVITITPKPDLLVTKNISVAGADVGDVISYNISVVNTGNVTISDIVIEDLNADPGSIVGSPIASIGPGQVAIINVTQTITQADMDAGFIENSATATGDSPNDGPDDVEDVSDTKVDGFGDEILDNETVESTDGNGNIDGDPTNDPTVTILIQQPELQVTKSITTPGAVVGDIIEYEITVLNSGNTTISNIDVTDTNADAGSIIGSPISTLAPGESAIVTAQQTITQADLDAGFVENSATATGDSPNNGPDDITDVSDTDIDNNGNSIAANESTETPNGDGTTDGNATNDPTVTSLTQNPSISLIKTTLDLTDDNGDGTIGGIDDEINYVFIVENTGDVTLSNVTLSDPLPGIIINGGPIATLAVGEVDSNTFTATYVITQADVDAGSVINSATVSAEAPLGDLGNPNDDITDDSDDPNNSTDFDNNGDGDPDDPTETSVTVFYDLAISKTVNEVEPIVGDEVIFTIEISNIGNVTATNIVVDEVIPCGYTFVSAIATAGSYSDFDGEWTITQLNPDQVEILEITVEVLGFGDYVNTATVVSAVGGTDVNPSNNSDSATLDPACLTFYNEFSPNGDGVNDTFVIDCIERYPNNLTGL